MAEKTDLSLRFYQSLESNEATPGLASIKKIIEGLELEPGEILGNPRKEKPTVSRTLLIEALGETENEKMALEVENMKFRKIIDNIPPDMQSWLRSHRIEDKMWSALKAVLNIPDAKKSKKEIG